MIKGELKMTCTAENVDVQADLMITQGIADKAFIIDTVCQALQLEGAEKVLVLGVLAEKAKDDFKEKGEQKDEG